MGEVMATKLTKAEKAKKLRILLVRSVNAHIKKGGKLISGGFQDTKGAYCPIGCATIGVKNDGFHNKLAEKLGFKLSEDDMWSFIYGFDNHGSLSLSLKDKNPFVVLGASLYKKYSKNLKRSK